MYDCICLCKGRDFSSFSQNFRKNYDKALIAELWRAKRACGAPWVSKSTHARKFSNHVTVPSVCIACSKRSDSGERCGVEKAMKSRGGLGREVREPLSHPLLLPRFYFFALPFTLHRSPLSERLKQAR